MIEVGKVKIYFYVMSRNSSRSNDYFITVSAKEKSTTIRGIYIESRQHRERLMGLNLYTNKIEILLKTQLKRERKGVRGGGASIFSASHDFDVI